MDVGRRLQMLAGTIELKPLLQGIFIGTYLQSVDAGYTVLVTFKAKLHASNSARK